MYIYGLCICIYVYVFLVLLYNMHIQALRSVEITHACMHIYVRKYTLPSAYTYIHTYAHIQTVCTGASFYRN